MSPITKAIIGVLAYQAIKAFTGSQANAGANTGKPGLKRLVADSMICSKVGWADYSEAALPEAG